MPVEANLHGRMWNDGKGDTAPAWAYALSDKLHAERLITAPRLRFVAPSGMFDYGGRYFPEHHAIAVIDTATRPRDLAVLVHECAHSILTKSGTSSHRGRHDAEFFAFLEGLYREARVSPAIARMIEDNGYPDSWNRYNVWTDWKKGNR